MTAILVFAAALAPIIVALVFSNIIKAMVRQHARERDLLMNQMLNLAGRPWQPAPAEPPFEAPEPVDYAFQAGWNPDE